MAMIQKKYWMTDKKYMLKECNIKVNYSWNKIKNLLIEIFSKM